MYTSIEVDHLIRQRTERLLLEARAGRAGSRARRGPRSGARWITTLLRRWTGPPRPFAEGAVEKA